MEKTFCVVLCIVAVVYSHEESETKVSRKQEGDYEFGVDHHFHGHWKGSSHPHGFAGLGDGHGDYKAADVKFVHFLPQSLYGGHGNHESKEGQNEEKVKDILGGTNESKTNEGQEDKEAKAKEIQEVSNSSESKNSDDVQMYKDTTKMNEYKSVVEGKESEKDRKDYGHGVSYTNFNMKSVVEEHHGKW